MKIIPMKTLVALVAVIILNVAGHPQKAFASDVELVLGTGSIKGKLFAAGNAISASSVLYGKGVKVYNYGTKGGKDNVKRVTKKKKSISLGIVAAKDLSKAKAKQIKKLSGLMSLGTLKGKQVLMIVRNKAPKKVSKAAYAGAIAEVVRFMQSSKAKKLIKKEWNGYDPGSGADAFKKAGVKIHKAAAK